MYSIYRYASIEPCEEVLLMKARYPLVEHIKSVYMWEYRKKGRTRFNNTHHRVCQSLSLNMYRVIHRKIF